MAKVVFLCDPSLCKGSCSASYCFKNGGECRHTSDYKKSYHYTTKESIHPYFIEIQPGVFVEESYNEAYTNKRTEYAR